MLEGSGEGTARRDALLLMIGTLLLFLLAIGGVTWVCMGMITKEQWPVRWLEINGAFERVSAEQVRASLVPLAVGSFFTVDLESIRSAAYRQPWVAEVTVQKTWPDTVKVQVTEFTPVAHWTGGTLISNSGQSFQVPGAAEIQGLPWLEGPEPQLDVVFETWQQFNNELLPLGLEIELIRLDPRGAWFLEMTNNTEVQIGREDALLRLQRLVKSWTGSALGYANPDLFAAGDSGPSLYQRICGAVAQTTGQICGDIWSRKLKNHWS